MKQAHFRLALMAAICGLVLSPTSAAQFGKLKLPGKSQPAQQTAGAFEAGGSMVSYLTIASDHGMNALEKIASVFPAEKIARFKEISAQYNEAKKSRKGGNIDAQSFTQVNEAGAEIAKLEKDWQTYSKERGPAVRQAHGLLGLMLLADAQASQQSPEVIAGLNSELQAISSDPSKIGRANQIRSMVSLLGLASKNLPEQISNFQTVRGIAKKIAAAEKYQLPDDPSPAQVKTAADVENSAKELSAE